MELRRAPAAVLAVAIVLLPACGGSGGEGSGDDHATHGGSESIAAPVEGASEITVTAVDIDFEPAALDITAGEPTNLTVVNDGESVHDFTLEAAGVHVNVDPGSSKTTSFTVDEPGTYEAICTVPGHADAGMRIDVTVSDAVDG